MAKVRHLPHTPYPTLRCITSRKGEYNVFHLLYAKDYFAVTDIKTT